MGEEEEEEEEEEKEEGSKCRVEKKSCTVLGLCQG